MSGNAPHATTRSDSHDLSGPMADAVTANHRMIAERTARGEQLEISALDGPPARLGITESEAYDLQAHINAQLERSLGWTRAGYKISMTAPEDRVPVQAEGPSAGVLFTHQILASGTELRLDQTNDVLLEPELVFRLSADITPDTDLASIGALLDVTGGIEIPMSRVPGWFPPGSPPIVDLSAFIADNSAAGFAVLADGWTPVARISDTTGVTVDFTEPDGTALQGTSSRVMDDPLTSVRWLLERILHSDGGVAAGTLISSGTLLPPRRPASGTFSAAFSDGLGTASVTFR